MSVPVLAAEINAGLFSPLDNDVMVRMVGVTGILVVANTILIEIFHRLSGPDHSADIRPISAARRYVDHAAIDAEIEQLQARIAELEVLKRRA
jgi:hypothetical protein